VGADRRLTVSRLLAALAVAAVLAPTGAAFWLTSSRAVERHDGAFERAFHGSVLASSDAIHDAERAVEGLAHAPDAQWTEAAEQERRHVRFDAVYAIERTGSATVEAAAVPPAAVGRATPLLGNRSVADALALAADSGDLVVSAPLDGGPEPTTVFVYARYAGPSDTVDLRRQSLRGWVVASAAPARVLGPVLGTVDQRLGRTSVDDAGSIVAGSAVADDASIPSVRLGVATREWTIRGEPSRGPRGTLPWVVLGVGVLLALAAARGVVVLCARHRRMQDAVAEQDRWTALLLETSPILQSSLDLGDILPRVAVRIADDLALDRVRICVAQPDGELRQVFGTGRLGAPGVTNSRDLPRQLASGRRGEPLWIPLERGDRVFGALELVPRRDVAALELRAIRVLAAAIGSALANAAAFQREQESVAKLEELDRLKDDFLATVCHEIRTPVTAIAGFARLLEGSWSTLPEAGREDMVHRISRNSKSLVVLAEELLAFARLERRFLDIQRSILDLAEVAPRIVDQMATLIEEHRLVIESDGPAPVLGDAVALDRILSNLITNAAKFSPSGTEITVRVDREHDRVVLRVDDAGAGVPVEERTRIFERFYRGDSERIRATRGAGIGLSVARELAGRMGASLSVTSSPAGGARFELAFPHPASQEQELTPLVIGGSR
jgi:signal transduction histidine kinase